MREKSTGENNLNSFGIFFVNAASKPPVSNESLIDENFYKPDFAKVVKIVPKQLVELEIPVETAQNFGLTFMADSQISATLFNDKGMIVGKNLTKTSEANVWFRSIYVNKDVSAGTWKLKLESTSDKELEYEEKFK